MNITVSALPVNQIVKDLARQFKVPIEEDSGELRLELPDHIGTGFIQGSSFTSGMGIITYNCTFFQNTEIHFVINKTHPLKFIFCSEGRIQHTFEQDQEFHTIHTYQNIIVSSSGNNGHVLYFRENERTQVFSLEIIRQQFNNRETYHYKDLDKQLRKLFMDSASKENFFHQGNYSMMAAGIVDEIHSKEYSGFLRSIFLEGKAFEMLAIQVHQYHDDQREDRLPQILRRSDVEKVKQTVELIYQDMSQNHSVDFLAKEVGTNVNKLQDGFKYMFNLTVNKYMQQAKLETAKELLSSTDYNISQIVGMIGLSNRSYFSKIFKQKYGVSPKYFLKSTMEENDNEL